MRQIIMRNAGEYRAWRSSSPPRREHPHKQHPLPTDDDDDNNNNRNSSIMTWIGNVAFALAAIAWAGIVLHLLRLLFRSPSRYDYRRVGHFVNKKGELVWIYRTSCSSSDSLGSQKHHAVWIAKASARSASPYVLVASNQRVENY